MQSLSDFEIAKKCLFGLQYMQLLQCRTNLLFPSCADI